MGTNKRYADRIDREVAAKLDASAARPIVPPPVVRDWQPPWPPIQISEYEWVIMRDSKLEPAGVIRMLKMGPRNETFYRVVTWAARSEDRRLVGYFDTLGTADRSMLFDPRSHRPGHEPPPGPNGRGAAARQA